MISWERNSEWVFLLVDLLELRRDGEGVVVGPEKKRFRPLRLGVVNGSDARSLCAKSVSWRMGWSC